MSPLPNGFGSDPRGSSIRAIVAGACGYPMARMADAVAETSLIHITAEPLSADRALTFVADPSAGGTCVFLGTVRDRSQEGEVTGLTYEAWDELATTRLREIAEEVLEKWSLAKVAI